MGNFYTVQTFIQDDLCRKISLSSRMNFFSRVSFLFSKFVYCRKNARSNVITNKCDPKEHC